MFWITFVVSGLTIASIPWVASHFSDRVAGYIVPVPIMMALSIIVQYTSHGPKATIDMVSGTLQGLPTLLVFGLVAIALMRHNVALPLVVAVSVAGWLSSLVAIHVIVGK
jgi:hypothetical protein